MTPERVPAVYLIHRIPESLARPKDDDPRRAPTGLSPDPANLAVVGLMREWTKFNDLE